MKICKVLMMLALVISAVFAQQDIVVTGWTMQDSADVASATGESIASATFDATGWLSATVPGTVLSTLVDQKAAGFTLDPLVGKNMSLLADIAKAQKRYWYRAKFDVSPAAGQRVWLHIDGINYYAFIYLNGKSVGTMKGAFKAGKFDITDLVTAGANYCAIRIRGNANPGNYHTKESGTCGDNGGVMTQDGPTFIASQGWDWIPTVADRDMGIWKPVHVRVTGPVVIRNPWIKTTAVSAASATVPLEVTLQNTTAAAVTGSLKATINGITEFAAQAVTIDANGSKTVPFPALTMSTPKLWWPNGYGEPNLYDCNITFTVDGAAVPSDTSTFKFGVREFTFQRGEGCGLIIKCNGQRILCRGGNWGMDDMMKRWDLHKLEKKIRYHKEMNFNMIRDWIGMTDNEPFYSFCDQYGIMVWSDFWQPHSADGTDPKDLDLYKDNMLDKILRVRNHACVTLWCARNETAPNGTLLSALQEYYTAYDGTRLVQPSSGSKDCHSGGPYTWTDIPTCNSKVIGFHTEIGSPTVPSYESLIKFLPAEADQMPMGNKTWSFHDYCSGNGNPTNYTNAMTAMWGAQSSIQNVCKVAQLMNYDEYRAYMESLQAKRFASNGASGLLLWMSNCVWPSLMWQTYDYYMEGTGAFYGCMEGAEPVHVMYYGGTNVQVINNTIQDIANYTVDAATYNLDGSKAWSSSKATSVSADNTTDVFEITKGTSTPYFLDLKLRDASGKLVSKNFYWLPNDRTNKALMLTMAKTTLAVTPAALSMTRSNDENVIEFKLVNTGTVCAVACRLKLTGETSGERILPCHYNDNYFSLAPGDTQDVVIRFDEVDRKNENPKLLISGINIDEQGSAVAITSKRRNVNAAIPAAANLVGGRIILGNLASGSPWSLTLLDMRGRVVSAAHGLGNGGMQNIAVPKLRSGIYVTMLKYNGLQQQTVVTIAR
ncbi:MAG: hypothetical protein JW913_18295 [Chitinispirillaceae bacterium]|nr:hypothetical protein [Chitinispirillaceae bacterium]